MFNSSWESFAYGKTCTVARNSADRPAIAARKSLNFKNVAVHVGIISATLNPAFGTAGNTTVNAGRGSSTPTTLQNYKIDWGARLKKARESLTLTIEETADLLGVSLSTLKKIQAGDTERPSREIEQKYLTFLELESFLNEALGRRKFAIVSALRSKKSAFGGMNSIEFAKRIGPDGVRSVLGILKRIYG